ncbi:MAG: response regulator [Candidatus Latescibacterota bacterium]|nr:response regulator [Candidatus Latescibacterota bacterium]
MLTNEKLIDIQEVANAFGKSVESIRKYKNFGIIRVSDKNGNKDLFDRSEILNIRIQLKELRLKGLSLSQIADEIDFVRKTEKNKDVAVGLSSDLTIQQDQEIQLKILLADNEPQIRSTVARHLEDLNYSVCETTDGEETIAKAFTYNPQLILLDLQLPKIDGYQVCKTLKGNSTTEPIPIIIITQLNTKAEKINAIECGADDYVEKPFDIDELVARIKMVSRRAARTF